MTVSRVAALYDIHGNLPALEAVLQEVRGLNVELLVFGGDLAWGPLPTETMDLISSLDQKAMFVRGNADREVAERHGETEGGLEPWVAEVNLWCADRLSDEHRELLRRMHQRWRSTSRDWDQPSFATDRPTATRGPSPPLLPRSEYAIWSPTSKNPSSSAVTRTCRSPDAVKDRRPT
jgi:hypothetical protein